ncbi:hypothetical protein [Antrihabitans cavernicola]|uniref:Uncharacterized protein n=1 Tax=Antrihabitans cavernicola TaxID=2495913 RepID=A0A5A7S4Y4_9NOCA|nr:hypothetical protein [Spelaeibacter cavernicola]KAA0017403.1 hypothetical protein FOY51_25240 [Spelaeibacter cavernicola]
MQRDLSRTEIAWWITDISSPAIVQSMRRHAGHNLRNSPMKFGPANGVAFLERDGWRAIDIESQFAVGARLKRLPLVLRPFAYLPQPNPRKLGRAQWSAVVRLQHVPIG